MMTAPMDAELMARVCAGDHDAFALIVERYKDSLVNYLSHMTGNRDRAEEHAQAAFVRLYESAARYREEGKLAPYLFRIATNLARTDAMPSRLRDLLLLRFWTRDERTTAEDSPLGDLQRRELQREVAAALASLPVAYRAAVVLREVEGWSYQEIAASLKCSEGTVKSRIARGREQLRSRLLPFWNGGPEREPRRAF
jgi:RNA polymerase sigma-70 factor, ECF subfamily